MPMRKRDRQSQMYRAELAVISQYFRDNPEKIGEFLGGQNVERDATPIDAAEEE